MIFTFCNKDETTKVADYLTIKYSKLDSIKRFIKDITENSVEIEILQSEHRFENEKDLINSVKQFTTDNNIQIDIQY